MSDSTPMQIALADLEYVLAWLRQSKAPANIIRLQERGMDLTVGRAVPDFFGAGEGSRPSLSVAQDGPE